LTAAKQISALVVQRSTGGKEEFKKKV